MNLSITQMHLVGKNLADHLHPGRPFLLYGDLGVGKTTLARSIVQTLAKTDYVPSPSFPIALRYETAYGALWHMDLYRINNPADIVNLGISEALAQDMCLIEWPDRLPSSLFSALHQPISCTLAFTDHDAYRSIALSPTPRGFTFSLQEGIV